MASGVYVLFTCSLLRILIGAHVEATCLTQEFIYAIYVKKMQVVKLIFVRNLRNMWKIYFCLYRPTEWSELFRMFFFLILSSGSCNDLVDPWLPICKISQSLTSSQHIFITTVSLMRNNKENELNDFQFRLRILCYP